MSYFPHVGTALRDTDWAELAQQKATLVSIIHYRDGLGGDDEEHLQGLLHFLDALMDAAATDGFPVQFLTPEEDA